MSAQALFEPEGIPFHLPQFDNSVLQLPRVSDEVLVDLFAGTKELDLRQIFVPPFMVVQQAPLLTKTRLKYFNLAGGVYRCDWRRIRRDGYFSEVR